MTEPHPHLSLSLPTIELQPSNNRIFPNIEWLQAADGAKLGCRVWKGSESAPVVIQLHGIEGHGQWFENTAAALNQKGLTIYAPDRRGSGMNSTVRGHLEDYRILLADIESHIKHIRRHHRGQRIIMIANCWSAKLASIFAQSNYESTDQTLIAPLAGLIFTGPAIYTRADFPLFMKLRIAFNSILGEKNLKRYWAIPITTSMLTDDPEYIKFIENDHLHLTEASTSFFVQTFYLSKKAQQSAKFIQIPVLILQGEKDQIVDLKKLQAWYDQIGSKDKTMKIFANASHSLDFDRASFKEYIHILSDWILAKGKLGI